jgi:hypothetical protein
MTRRMVLIACCLLLLPPAYAQEAADPVTGKWGEDGLSFLELSHDGQGVVSGTVIWRHRESGYENRVPIKTGSYNPKTRVLKLEGDMKTPEGEPATYLIEGTIEKGTISGTFKAGERSGQFTFKKL